MRIALLALGRRGAPPRYSFMMARALARRAHVLAIVAADAENLSEWRAEAEANPRLTISVHPTYRSRAQFILRSIQWWRYTRIARCIRAFRPDVVYSPFCHYWEKTIYARLKNLPSVGTIHDLTLHPGEDSPLERLIDRFIKKHRFDRYVILTDSFRSTLTHRGIPSSHIVTVPHAAFATPPADIDLTPRDTILFFGRIVHYKGLGVLLDAMPIIHRSLPRLRLIIAGQGDYTPYLPAITAQKDYIELHDGWVAPADIDSYILRADAVVLPYIEASQSGIIPLAQSLGRPAVASDIGGLPAQIQSGRTGLLVPPGSPEALAGAIISLYHHPAKLRDMKTACLDFARSNTWDRSARTLTEFLQNNE